MSVAACETYPAPLLDVHGLRIDTASRSGSVPLVESVDLVLAPGEILGVAGESGCGKSISMLAIAGLLPPGLAVTAGHRSFEGIDLAQAEQTELRKLRGSRIGFVFQDPMTSFNPVMRIGDQLCEAVVYHKGLPRKDAWQKCIGLLERVGIANAASRMQDYPHQLSGGMRQRCMIAMALTCDPSLLIADEPTTALDVTTQADVVRLIKSLRRELGLAVIWISHDLVLLSQVADRVAVFYSGRVVEEGRADRLLADPQHPYTKALIECIPGRLAAGNSRKLNAIGGFPPDPSNRPAGCAFAPRCGLAIARCQMERPHLLPTGNDQAAACFVTTGEAA